MTMTMDWTMEELLILENYNKDSSILISLMNLMAPTEDYKQIKESTKIM